MDRRKNVASNSSGSYREFTKCTTEMDLILLNAMIDEAGLSGIKKNQVKNCQKSLKDRWREVHDLFGGLSGFAWNQTTKHFEAEDEVWSELIKAKPSAAKWRVNLIRHYNLMEELWSNDRATGSRVKTARDINSPIDMSNFIIALYMASSSQKCNRTHKGKSPAKDVVVPPQPATRIEQVLDYSIYYAYSIFAAPGFEFQNALNWQGLQPFLGINLPYYEDLVRVFYTNVKITHVGHFAIEICGMMIHIKEMDWMTIAHLQYDGLKLTPGTIPEELNFDRALALSSMIREDVEGENLRNVGSLKMNDRLLHYTWVHILYFDVVVNKNNVLINWPHYIMQHIIKCRDNKMHLPYANLITRILQVYGFDLSNKQPIMLGWNHYFGKKSMKKLNIFQVNDVWQLGRPHHAHEEDDEEDELPAQDVEGGQPEAAIPNQIELLTQILSEIQNMNTCIDRVDQRMDRIEDTLNDIRRHQDH
ncbi:hypothetical protein PHAVU_002G150300 [Phaseolus vulgaris]|uniref:Myb/SANT-like domain-containing protein n=1 Tax=Phaseolus vulgaris TaxID=3885 RepID=V7CJU1_PHAVU|nr:hypothetical protein PHAVU_002G150300g [Phaseolus vulgaris]ESW30399.1 hypothetical protein PHAVU_002G150300g [Phaseolus vulgaris]